MKLYKVIFWGIIGMAIGYAITHLIWPSPWVIEDLVSRCWFLTIGIIAGWLFKPEGDKR